MRLQVPIQGWEYRLLAWAQEPLRSLTTKEHVHSNQELLQAAYRYCEALTLFHSRTFYVASSLLPTAKRRAARALYAFCRITDNLVDESHNAAQSEADVEDWRLTISQPHPPANEPVALAWVDTQARFQIPSGYAEQLIQGVKRDLTQKRYANFNDLAEYSYGVASTVGLMVMHIVGFENKDAMPYAVKLGVALQLTNILRDIADDWRSGRVYLPQDELVEFSLCDADIGAGKVDDRWRAFMKRQIERNRQLYAESHHGIRLLNPDGRFAIAAAAGLYQGILDDIEARDYNVFGYRARVSNWGKLCRLPGIWWSI